MERIDLKAATKSTLLTVVLALIGIGNCAKHNQRRRGIFVDGGVWREKVDK